jgi:hypothetical protein
MSISVSACHRWAFACDPIPLSVLEGRRAFATAGCWQADQIAWHHIGWRADSEHRLCGGIRRSDGDARDLGELRQNISFGLPHEWVALAGRALSAFAEASLHPNWIGGIS